MGVGMLYPHPLDYIVGMKYHLTDLGVKKEFRISSETFQVEELIDLTKYGFTVNKTGYAVLKVVKKNTDTFETMRKLSKILDIPSSNILFMGLKDKNALSISYFFINHQFIDQRMFPVINKDFSISLLGFIKRKPRKSMHIANKFVIKLPEMSENEKDILKRISKLMISIGLPSYYGYQRFGTIRYNTHLLGKYVILGREDLFSMELLKSMYISEERFSRRMCGDFEDLFYEKVYTSRLHIMSDKVLGFSKNIYIDAYASYLYNLLINMVIKTTGYTLLNRPLPMPGCLNYMKYYEKICKKEGLTTYHLTLMPCFMRNGLFYPFDVKIYETNEGVFYTFYLKPGMYATVVLREIFKEYLRLN
ncbi:MAG: tRNA pseudouridine(13) synthase TruD [Desulfurococcaceae archaeon]